MTELDVLVPLRRVVEAFERMSIGYYVGGSVASSLYGVPRTTNDADVIAALEPHHARPLADALEAEFYVDEESIRDAISREGMFNVIHNETAMKVDVYVLRKAAWDREAFDRRRNDSLRPDEVSARTYAFGSAEDILLHKLVWFRMGGEVSERQWKDVLGVLRVQQTLDVAYLDRWAPLLGIADLLARARAEIAR